jgi:hypothetical protein
MFAMRCWSAADGESARAHTLSHISANQDKYVAAESKSSWNITDDYFSYLQ